MVESSARRRILALWLPRLSTDRLQRRERASGRLDRRPLVIAAKVENALRLTAVDANAARLGLMAGMALADSRARIPELTVEQANPGLDLKLLEEIAAWCERYTPLVALDAPNGLYLDITGASHLFGGERAMLENVQNAISRQGFTIRLALAGTSTAARALTRFADGAIALPGEEVKAVAPLPVEALGVDQTTVHALKRAGLKTIGQVAGRGRGELRGRFASEFVFTLDCALGKAESPIAPRTPIPDLMAERRFADPVVTEAIIAATIQSLAASLASVLERRDEGARHYEACFFRADGQMRKIAVETGEATRDPAMVDRLFKEKLDALADPLDPGFGFDLIRLNANGTQPLHAQAPGFDAKDYAKEIRFLADRLSARFGRHRVMRFLPQDTHIPEAEAAAIPAQDSWTYKIVWKREEVEDGPHRPLRLFSKPEPIEAIAEVPDGPPLRFRWRRALHTVVLAEGPERIAMEWWRTQGTIPTRDYFRIEDEAGRRFWIFRDGLYGREAGRPHWYLHGSFA